MVNCVCDITGPRDWKSTNLVEDDLVHPALNTFLVSTL